MSNTKSTLGRFTARVLIFAIVLQGAPLGEMARASAAFCTISRGAYTSLATQQEKDSEILIAVAADRKSIV